MDTKPFNKKQIFELDKDRSPQSEVIAEEQRIKHSQTPESSDIKNLTSEIIFKDQPEEQPSPFELPITPKTER